MSQTSHAVDAAMAAAPRANFLPRAFKKAAGIDSAIPIGGGSTCSQPTTVRNMLLLLDAQPGHRVLDVGSGSGWTTAILANLVGGGEVIGVELISPLVSRSRDALSSLGIDNAQILLANRDNLGHPEGAPYDRILFSANAERGLPTSLVEQLADGGIMVGPVDGVMTVVAKGLGQTAGQTEVTEHGLYRFVPLQEG